jgi:starvation-inducible DNA-binding protein
MLNTTKRRTSMADLVKAARIAFASQYSYVLKAQNFHWNVEGSDFSEYHKLFGMIYEEAEGTIDDFAENIRKLGAYAPAGFNMLSSLSTIEEIADIPDAMTMIGLLAEDSIKMAELCAMVYEIAEAQREFGFANFLADRQDAFKKHAWMLNATLK